jgi:cytidylate kinase
MPDPSLIIAISRQRGSGGAEVGRRLAAELDLRYIDRQMLRHAAEFLQLQDERAATDPTAGTWWSRIGEAIGMGATSFTHAPPSLAILSERELLGIEERLLNETAEHGGAVIVGCGAAQLLKGRPRVLSVFLHAPGPWRQARVCELYGLDGQAAEHAVRESDRNRCRFIQQLTGGPWGQPGSYDITLDTSVLGVEAAAALLSDIVRKRAVPSLTS